eukprot:TRINITY_DN7820_c0_g1_i4.p1 TRINITY_DN7820_c0_g1~~TRINITY_DN7820_c0_g1_i4.p1  ORF type:complete len:369 (-),score=66.32 TRINITY_DN7820_c0_g1_i4:35-1141(-)
MGNNKSKGKKGEPGQSVVRSVTPDAHLQKGQQSQVYAAPPPAEHNPYAPLWAAPRRSLTPNPKTISQSKQQADNAVLPHRTNEEEIKLALNFVTETLFTGVGTHFEDVTLNLDSILRRPRAAASIQFEQMSKGATIVETPPLRAPFPSRSQEGDLSFRSIDRRQTIDAHRLTFTPPILEPKPTQPKLNDSYFDMGEIAQRKGRLNESREVMEMGEPMRKDRVVKRIVEEVKEHEEVGDDEEEVEQPEPVRIALNMRSLTQTKPKVQPPTIHSTPVQPPLVQPMPVQPPPVQPTSIQLKLVQPTPSPSPQEPPLVDRRRQNSLASYQKLIQGPLITPQRKPGDDLNKSGLYDTGAVSYTHLTLPTIYSV